MAVGELRVDFNRPIVVGKEFEYMKEAIENAHISGDGFFTKKCHALLENQLGVPKALLTTSCTHALEMSAILLDIQPAHDGRVNILGQVAADDQDQWTGASVELRREDQLQFSTEIDDLGAFRFEDAMPGAKELRIISNDRSLIVVSIIENSA